MGLPATPYLQVVKGSRGLLFKFWDPFISRERSELETSYLTRRLITRGINKKNTKLGQRVGKGSRDLLLKFWDPPCLGNC